MRYSVVLILMAIFAGAAHCELRPEALRVVLAKFLKFSMEYQTDCIKSTNASEELITKFWDNEYTMGENDPTLKCYLYCLYFKTGFVDEKSRLIVDSLTNKDGPADQILFHNSQVIEKVIEFCVEPKSPDPCESAYQQTQCAFKWFNEVTSTK